MNKATLTKAAKELGVARETLTKENKPLLDKWLEEQEAKPKPVKR